MQHFQGARFVLAATSAQCSLRARLLPSLRSIVNTVEAPVRSEIVRESPLRMRIFGEFCVAPHSGQIAIATVALQGNC
ncbi:hypothetical protein CVO74_04175 [Xanthomonas prunicola]|uniref:Uncharacterized protein n=1 Tax=Xanthomonas prunicola TaxID=2053930 RepID=A0A2N3RNB3_9XANT|nr:hypothetical protein XpruCFBP8353_02285 [Xanthomonas prunicola]PKV18241.1 hypothetical protein XpruCFBP8354_02285 [Xanthomonas prunicola]PKV22448.1 hypothetical protein CVO74_04175 [Xanthomonas prunicola]